MKLRKMAIWLLVFLSMASLAACDKLPSGQKDSPASKITLSPDKTAIVGQVTDKINPHPPITNTVVRLAKVFWNEDHTKGAFVAEGATSPSSITDDKGYFQFPALDPGEYVIIVGELLGKNVIISKPDGKPRIYTPAGGKVMDVGTLEVDLRQ
jgi:hypothetical protein